MQGASTQPIPGRGLPDPDLIPGALLGNGYGRSAGADAAYALSPLAGGGSGDGSTGFRWIFRTIKRRQGLFLFTFALVTSALAINTLRQRIFSPVFQGSFLMQISNPFETAGGGTGNVEAIARAKPTNNVPNLIVLLRSPLLLQSIAESQGVSISQLVDNLSIAPVEDVQEVLNVSLRWKDPAKGRAILTQLSQEYIKFSKASRRAAVDSGVRFLDEQAPDLLRRSEKLQKELRTFRERNNFLDPSAQAAALLSARDDMVASLSALQVEQVQLESRIASVKAGKLKFSPSGAPRADILLGPTSLAVTPRNEASAQGAQATGGKTPFDQLNQLEQELASAKATYREDSPIVQSIKAKRDELLPVVQRQALEALQAELFSNTSQQDEANRQIEILNKKVFLTPLKVKEYEELQERLGVARENYSSYIRARENFRLERARSLTPWQVISPAEFDDTPVEPNLRQNLLRALMLGLLSGVGAAILRERTDNVFHTPIEAEKELQLPVLGLIPYLPLEPGVEISASIEKMSSSERFAIKESLRSLFTTFRLLRADRDIRLVGITSSTQGEGKSTAVSVFARTLADLGLKVLVVDADMRLPMQSRYMGSEQGDGLSTLLSDSSTQAESLILPIQENLDMIPAGPKPPDPAKLLNSIRCQEVVDQVRALPGYDMILWDAPPCLMLADPILLGEKLDGILFLVGLGKVSREVAPQACRRIKATGVDVLGLICNQVTFPTRLNDYGYEYGYFYHYAYANNYGNYAGRYATTGPKANMGGYAKRVGGYVKGSHDSYAPTRYLREGVANERSRSADSPNGQIGSPTREAGETLNQRELGPGANSENASIRKRKVSGTGITSWLRRRFGAKG
jgi:capsular exopolysaccharide synthesis family protein